MKKLRLAFAVAATIASAVSAAAQGYSPPKEGDWVARDFRFHTGEVAPDERQDPKALQKAVFGLLYRAEEDLA
jgi:hypothetical protein